MSEVEENPTLDFVNALQGEDYNDAEKLFNGILGDKLQQSLDAEKVAVADSIFNGVESEDISIDDEDLDAELAQVTDQEETVD
tara:strand:+ start:632 stop:880 length:249 start_codon:yes stop_codon:yes gene_type:complete